MMDDKRVADYFVVAGLPTEGVTNGEGLIELDEYSNEAVLKTTHNQDPIVDICVIIRSVGELCPKGYTCVDKTPTGHVADLNHGSIRAPEVYLCYRRGRDKPPITDIGVLYDGKEKLMPGCEVVEQTIGGRVANVNNNNNKSFLNYRRADPHAASDMLAVTDICVIITSKGEIPPHAFCQIHKNLNRAMVGSDVFLCYKKSVAKTNTLSFKPSLLSRYPQLDHESPLLPESVPMFCLPLGVSVEAWSKQVQIPAPVYSTFVLTGELGEKMYGAAVMFYEKIPRQVLTEAHQRELGVLIPAQPSSTNGKDSNPDGSDTSDNARSKTDSTSDAANSSVGDDANHSKDSTTSGSDDNKTVEADTAHSDKDTSGEADTTAVMNNTCESSGSSDRTTLVLSDKAVYSNKCICLLGRWPFFDTYRKFLSFLYRMSQTGTHAVPLERHISHFMHEIPFPSPQRPHILVQLNDESISLYVQEETPLTQSGASFITFLKNMGPDNCLLLLLLILLENKILVHSLRPAVLTSVAEALANIIFPFHWQCPYIPLCPLGLSDVLSAPCPFIVGIDSRYFDLYDPPPDVTCVDIDTNNITISDDKKGLSCKLLPKRPMKVLKATLDRLFEQLTHDPHISSTPLDAGLNTAPNIDDFSKQRKEVLMELRIREAFLRFMASILKNYNNYLLPITQAPTPGTTDLRSLFDTQGFLKSRDKSYHKFFNFIMKTQEFSRFIEERSFVSDKDASLAFFDECTEKVDEYKDEPKLIETDDILKSDRTVFIPLPDNVGLSSDQNYTYNGFPLLKPQLFLSPSKPSIVTPLKLPGKCPNTPMTRRTKQEVKSAQKTAQRLLGTPMLWAKCLLSHTFSLWFIHLPSYVKTVHSKPKALKTAYHILERMQNAKLQPPDEVCYRVLLQLCGLYEQPVLAVKVLFQMKNTGIKPNAITYGFYNKAVLESKWPSAKSADQHWSKIRNLVMAVSQFRQAVRHHGGSAYSASESDCDRLSQDSSVDDHHDKTVPAIQSAGMAKPTNYNADVIGTGSDSPNIEERASTGGMSDRGYSSMTLEDSKRTSSVISSEDSLDSLLNKHKISTPIQTIIKPSNDHKEQDCNDGVEQSKAASQANEHGIGSIPTSRMDRFPPAAQRILFPSDLVTSSSTDNKTPIVNIAVSSPTAAAAFNKERTEDSCDTDGTIVTDAADTSILAEPLNDSNVLIDVEDSTGGGDTTQDSVFTTTLGSQTQATSSASPVHSVRTPVTENDPLGLFVHSTPTTDTANAQPSTVKAGSSMGDLLEVEDGVKPKTKLHKAVSFDSTDAISSVNFKPVGQTDCDSKDAVSQDALSKDSMSQSGASKENLASSSSSVGHGWLKRSKALMRGESFSKALRTTTSMFSKGYSEMKQHITPLKNSLSGSNNSLPQVGEEGCSGATQANNTRRHSRARHTGSLDDLDEVDVGHGDGNTAVRFNRYGEYMVEFLEKLPAIPSLAQSVDSLKSIGKGARADSQASLDQLIPAPPSHFSTADSESQSSDTARRQLAGSVNSLLTAGPPGSSSGSTLFSVACQVEICTLSRCKCGALLYDEEIMAGWTADESNLNTVCQFCRGSTVPMMQVYIKDLRHSHQPTGLGCAQSVESILSQSRNAATAGHHRKHSNVSNTSSKSADQHKTRKSSKVDGTASSSEPRDATSGKSHNRTSGGDVDKRDSGDGTGSDGIVDNLIDVTGAATTACSGITVVTNGADNVGSAGSDAAIATTITNAGNLPDDDTTHTSSSSTLGLTNGADVAVTDDQCESSDSVLIDVTISNAGADDTLLDGEKVNVTVTDAVNDGQPLVDLSDTKETNNGTPDQKDKCATVSDEKFDSLSPNASSHELSHNGDITESQETLSPKDNAMYTTSATTDDVTAATGHQDDGDVACGDTCAHNTSVDGQGSDACSDNVSLVYELDPISVPYLSPLVLRKEMESLMEQDGELCLSKENFLDEHPIVYWNLVWYFKRLETSSHLPGLVLTARATNQHAKAPKCWQGSDSRHVQVRCMWDNAHMHTPEDGIPLYKLWTLSNDNADVIAYDPQLNDGFTVSRSVMQRIISDIMINNVVDPIKILLSERRKHQQSSSSAIAQTRPHYRSIYREILFLSFIALERDNIDHDAFDREFQLSYKMLSHGDSSRLKAYDRSPNMAVIWARKLFSELILE